MAHRINCAYVISYDSNATKAGEDVCTADESCQKEDSSRQPAAAPADENVRQGEHANFDPDRPHKAIIGLDKIWVHHSCRRKGVASRVVDVIRSSAQHLIS